VGGDDDFNKILVVSKIQDKIERMYNNMNKIVMKLATANININAKLDNVTIYTDEVVTKNALMQSDMESMAEKTEKLTTFIENNEDLEITDIDDFVKPQDEISESILKYIAKEKA
jgi:hypothetical protein